MPEASSLEAALREATGIQAELVKGDRGIFEVRIDSELVFSKKSVGRFPNNAEIVKIVRDRA